jgi:hypothetical protein
MYDGGRAIGSGVLLYGFVMSFKKTSTFSEGGSMGGQHVAQHGEYGGPFRLTVAGPKAEFQPRQ